MGRGKEAAEILSYRKRECRGAEYDYKPYDTASVGATGALFGLMGVLFVFGIKFKSGTEFGAIYNRGVSLPGYGDLLEM